MTVLLCTLIAAVATAPANVLVFEGRIIPPPGQAAESYTVCLEHHEGRRETPPSSFLRECRPNADGVFRVEAEVRAGEEEYALYIRDSVGRATFGYPHLDKSRDFGEITLCDDCDLSGMIWTPEGEAGAGLPVTLERRLEGDCSHYIPAAETKADAGGAFAFQQINPGKYRVQSQPANYTHPPVEIDVCDDLSYVEINLKKAFAISGRVVLRDGSPVAGATVRVDRRPAVQTDDDGHYRIAGLGADTYSLRAWTDNMAVANYADTKVQVSDADVVAPDISLVPAGALRVVLNTESNATAVLPERLRIRLAPRQSETRWFAHRADAPLDGQTALFDSLAPGDYQLSLMEKALGDVQADVTVASETTGEIVLNLPEVFTLKGIVVDEEGQPLVESRIMLSMQGPPAGRRQNISSYHHAYSDKEGRFKLVGLPRGRGMLRITTEKHVPLVKDVTLPADEDEYHFTIIRGMTVAVRLVDEEGQPVAGAEVKLQKADKGSDNLHFYYDRSAKSEDGSDADGIAVLHGVEPGKYEAHIEAPEHYADPQSVEIQAGTDRLDDIALQRGKALAGTVSEADGTPVANAHVVVYRTDVGSGFSRRSFVSRQTQTDDNGAFSISGLPDGRYSIQVMSGESYGELIRLNETPAGSEDIMIILGEKQMLTVQVLDPDDNPVKDAELMIARHDSRTVMRHDPSSFRRTDHAGRFTTEIRRGFEYMIEARKTPWMDVKHHLDLTADGEMPDPLVLRMLPGLAFSGTVLDSQGRERGDVFVAVGDREPVSTDIAGQFTIEGLAPGVVNVKVYADNNRGKLLAMQRLILSATETVDNVRIELPELGKISGIARDSDGNPLVNTGVHLSLTGTMPWFDSESFDTQTGTDGSFEFADLVPGDYGIVVMQTESVMPIMRTVKINPGEAVTVNLPETEHRIRLEQGRVISGTVRLEPGGSIERAFVMALTEAGAVAGGGAIKTDGCYEIEPHLPAGRYALVCIHADLAGETAMVDLKDDLIHDFVLKPAGDITVKLQGPGDSIVARDVIIEDQVGNPVQRLRIQIPADDTSEFLGAAVIPPTDSEGQTKVRKLPVGKYTVRLKDEISTEIIVAPFGETSAVLTL